MRTSILSCPWPPNRKASQKSSVLYKAFWRECSCLPYTSLCLLKGYFYDLSFKLIAFTYHLTKVKREILISSGLHGWWATPNIITTTCLYFYSLLSLFFSSIAGDTAVVSVIKKKVETERIVKQTSTYHQISTSTTCGGPLQLYPNLL